LIIFRHEASGNDLLFQYHACRNYERLPKAYQIHQPIPCPRQKPKPDDGVCDICQKRWSPVESSGLLKFCRSPWTLPDPLQTGCSTFESRERATTCKDTRFETQDPNLTLTLSPNPALTHSSALPRTPPDSSMLQMLQKCVTMCDICVTLPESSGLRGQGWGSVKYCRICEKYNITLYLCQF
jgi:hypothetical protein